MHRNVAILLTLLPLLSPAASPLAAILSASTKGGEGCRLAIVQEAGRDALQVTANKGAAWSSLLVPPELLGHGTNDCSKVKAVLLDVRSDDAAKLDLQFELWDTASVNHGTRSTLHGAALAPGKQTLRWDLTRCRRNGKESAVWESLDEADKIDLAHVTRAKLYLTPPKDRDYVFFIDAVRLEPKTPDEMLTEQQTAAAASSRRVIFSSDFENGKGLGGEGIPFKGNWRGLYGHEKPVLESPKGTGNPSKLACTVHAKKGSDSAMELPQHHTEIEPRGWDATVTLKIYNGGFERFNVHYSPIFPSDTTFCRAYFTAPTGQWTEVALPFDKFLFQGRRPRRGTEAEYFCITAAGPAGDDRFFQFDDFTISRTRRADLAAPKAKPAIPDGVAYRQDFDDPNDFDVEGFYPLFKDCNAFRVAGGLGVDGKEADLKQNPDAGCLSIEAYRREGRCCAGRRVPNLNGATAVVEFDCYPKGVRGFGLTARSGSGRYAWSPKTPPPANTWTHIVAPLAEFTPEQARTDAQIWEIGFAARADDTDGNYVLIDNLVVRTARTP